MIVIYMDLRECPLVRCTSLVRKPQCCHSFVSIQHIYIMIIAVNDQCMAVSIDQAGPVLMGNSQLM